MKKEPRQSPSSEHEAVRNVQASPGGRTSAETSPQHSQPIVVPPLMVEKLLYLLKCCDIPIPYYILCLKFISRAAEKKPVKTKVFIKIWLFLAKILFVKDWMKSRSFTVCVSVVTDDFFSLLLDLFISLFILNFTPSPTFYALILSTGL